MIPLSQHRIPALRLLQDGIDYFDYSQPPTDTLDKVDPKNMQLNLVTWTIFAYMVAEWPGYFR